MELYKHEYKLKNGQTITLRPACIGDEKGLLHLLSIVDGETKFLAREPGELNFTLEQEREFIESIQNDQNSTMLVVEMDGNIIGNCSVGVVMKQLRYLHRASMGLCVMKDYWHQGIGKILVKACIDWCNSRGIEQLELDVVTTNKQALSMYKRFGFQICGTKKHALKYADGTYADEYSMILFIEQS